MLVAISMAQPTMPTDNENYLVLEEKSPLGANDEVNIITSLEGVMLPSKVNPGIDTASEVILRTPRSIDNNIAPGKIYCIQLMHIIYYDIIIGILIKLAGNE